MPALTRSEVDGLGCESPDCDHKDHSGFICTRDVVAMPARGHRTTLTIRCRAREKAFVEILVVDK